MSSSNINFKLLSLNVRGIRNYEKRKAIFLWISKQNADVIFLQETYSTKEVEQFWRLQWKGEIFFAHGSEHSKGVMILTKEGLDIKITDSQLDLEGRFIFLDTIIQDSRFCLINIYAPNKVKDQKVFFESLISLVDQKQIDCGVIIGGDFNVAPNPSLDCQGGNPVQKESFNQIKDLSLSNDLVDIWRIRNPDLKKFTWSQKSPFIQRRLDYWLISDYLQDDVNNTFIKRAIKTDHSAIILQLNSIENHQHGPSHWRFNSSLIDDPDYIKLINESYPKWLQEFDEVMDKRVLWDLIKYKIRQETMRYSKMVSRNRKKELNETESKLEHFENLCASDPCEENITALESVKLKYEQLY